MMKLTEQKLFEKAKKVRYEDLEKDAYKMYFSEYCSWNEGCFNDIEDFKNQGDPPENIWGTIEIPLTINARDLIERETEDMYEDAIEFLDVDGLQKLIDAWIEAQGDNAKSYEVSYDVAILL